MLAGRLWFERSAQGGRDVGEASRVILLYRDPRAELEGIEGSEVIHHGRFGASPAASGSASEVGSVEEAFRRKLRGKDAGDALDKHGCAALQQPLGDIFADVDKPKPVKRPSSSGDLEAIFQALL